MDQRVCDLIRNFDSCCDAFDHANLFTGPSAYFHFKTLALRRQHSSAGEAVLDRLFLESVYATLTAWGMHRMGPGDTKLIDFDTMADSFRRLEKPIKELSAFTLTRVQADQVDDVSERVWRVIRELKIGQGLTKIVAGSKALHHVLPELVPPIDREYTLCFFFHHKTLSQGDEVAFREMYPRFHRIACECRGQIEARIGRRMNTSFTKVIDNGIVGFVRTRLKAGLDPSV
jgi:hypothetical protein